MVNNLIIMENTYLIVITRHKSQINFMFNKSRNENIVDYKIYELIVPNMMSLHII